VITATTDTGFWIIPTSACTNKDQLVSSLKSTPLAENNNAIHDNQKYGLRILSLILIPPCYFSLTVYKRFLDLGM
jgi:hypothetical protein